MSNMIGVERLLIDPVNAVLFHEIYTAQQAYPDGVPKFQDVLRSSREHLERKKIEHPKDLIERVSKFKEYEIAEVILGAPFTGGYTDRIKLSEFGLSLVECVEKTLRTY